MLPVLPLHRCRPPRSAAGRPRSCSSWLVPAEPSQGYRTRFALRSQRPQGQSWHSRDLRSRGGNDASHQQHQDPFVPATLRARVFQPPARREGDTASWSPSCQTVSPGRPPVSSSSRRGPRHAGPSGVEAGGSTAGVGSAGCQGHHRGHRGHCDHRGVTGVVAVIGVPRLSRAARAEGGEESRGLAEEIRKVLFVLTRREPPLLPIQPEHGWGRCRLLCRPCHPHRNVALAAWTRSPPQTRAVSLSTGAVCCSAATREGFSSRPSHPSLPPSGPAGDPRRTSTSHTCECGRERPASPHTDGKADCSGVFTRIRIKGSLTLRCVTSEQRSHGYFYAIKPAGNLPSAFLCFVPSPAHLSL